MSNGKQGRFGRVREWLTIGFSYAEDAIYVGLGLLLVITAFTLLINELIYFIQYVSAGTLTQNVISVLDRILLVIIFVEVLYTVQVSFSQHILRPEPFLIVSMIAVTRRILVLTAELQQLVKEKPEAFYNAMIELGLLTVLIIVLVVCLRLLSRSVRAGVDAAQQR
jgi:uncharacterized membrane protein (DUF373 family)